MPNRATGADVYFRAAFESEYGVQAPSGYHHLSAYSFGLAGEQGLTDERLLGAGREPGTPTRDPLNVRGEIEVPIDYRRSGIWLRLLLGAAQSDTQIGARGHIDFTTQPANNSTIVLKGTTWTFKTAGATGPQTNIGATLEATLDQLVSDLNASADTNIDDATYSRVGDRLVIQHDTATTAGNSFTLATTVTGATVSGATLSGGGYYRHIWHSGASALPSATIETYFASLEPGSKRFRVHKGVMANSLQVRRERTGAAKMTLDLVGRNEDWVTATVAGTPTNLVERIFSQYQGLLLLNGRPAANLSSADLTYSNNLVEWPGLRSDGLMEGYDPGLISIAMEIQARFSDNEIQRAAEAADTIELLQGWYDPATGAELRIECHEIHLPLPRRSIDGPEGIDVTYTGVGARDATAARSATFSLINDVASYA